MGPILSLKIVIICILSTDARKGPNCEWFRVLYRRQNMTESYEKITFKENHPQTDV